MTAGYSGGERPLLLTRRNALASFSITSAAAISTWTNLTLIESVVAGAIAVQARPRYDHQVNTVAGLRAVVGPIGSRIDLTGWSSPGDGGGGVFVAAPGNSRSDDGGLVVVDATGLRWKRQTTTGLTTDMFGIFPGQVSAAAIVAMNTAAAGRPITWRPGSYEVDGRLTLGAVDVDWRSAGSVTLKLVAARHLGGSWVRTDASVSTPGFVFDGSHKTAKIFDARTGGIYTHRLDFTGATFKNGVQPATNGRDPDPTGHSAGLVVDGKFDVVNLTNATFRDIDALATGAGASRPNSRGFAVMDGAKSPRVLIANKILVEDIVCSKKAWGISEIEADGFVYRNSIPEHMLLMDGARFRNCQKRYVKANIALNTFITNPDIIADAGKPALIGIDFQVASGHVRGGSSYFADAAAWPRAGLFSVVTDRVRQRSIMFRDHDIRCPEAVPDDGAAGIERCILTIGGSTPGGKITMTEIRADVSIPVVVHIRPIAIARSGEALVAPVRNVHLVGNWVREVTVAAVRADRSGRGFVYVFLEAAANRFQAGVLQTSVDLVATNVKVTFVADSDPN